MATGDLTTLAVLKASLSSSGTITNVDDAYLNRVITSVSQFIRSTTGRDLVSTSYVEKRNGNGQPRLFTLQYPVTAVAGVTINTVSVPAAQSSLQYGYLFDQFSVYLTGYNVSGINPFSFTDGGQWFSKGFQNVQLNYTAGFLPGDAHLSELEQICIELVSMMYARRKRFGLASVSMGGETTTYIVRQIATQDIIMALEQYKRKWVPV